MTGQTPVGELIELVETLGFVPETGKPSTWIKQYGSRKYAIRVNIASSLKESKIDFGKSIKLNRPIPGFDHRESTVVLECIDRLLSLGYSPSQLVLEKSYPLGHNNGGWLDILVLRKGVPFWMIECKTWGKEYEKAHTKLVRDGGQLFTYWVQDRSVQWVTLYASSVTGGVVENRYASAHTDQLSGTNVQDVFSSWDGVLKNSGFFDGSPYDIGRSRLKVSDLKDIQAEDSNRIFHEFEEILRRNAVSDKPNAFNKIFNLFICKVQDEEKTNPVREVDFQWFGDEDSEAVLNRLGTLYAEGLNNFLQVKLPDHSLAQVESLLQQASADVRAEVLRAFSEMKTLSNSDFSFIDVFDQTTLKKNTQVVKEVVRLLQDYRIRYTHKQPFMGEFFERLLSTSVKQEQGQYFTPIPLARFVLHSLPIERLVNDKVSADDPNFLPYMIDYAAGAGHFLTEGMDVVDQVVSKIDSAKLTRSQAENLTSWANLKWAREFVYGIEKDYRLAKTAKVACFLNGDGEANIITADGLAQFSDPDNGYVKRLVSQSPDRENQKFDVLVANPPYSVEECKSKVANGSNSFSLWPTMTESSDDIECLFAERATQLVADGGVAGIIFPASIAQSEGSIYVKTRELLLENFDVIGLVALGSAAFSDANVQTTTFFLRRVPRSVWTSITSGVAAFTSTWNDHAIGGVNAPIEKYARQVWDMTLAEYVDVLRDSNIDPSSAIAKAYLRTLGDQRKWKKKNIVPTTATPEFWVLLRETETKKMRFFLRNLGRATVLVNSPAPLKEQKEMLGYQFKAVNGTSAMVPARGAVVDSALTSDFGSDQDRISAIIRSNFLGANATVPSHLQKYASVVELNDLIDFKSGKFPMDISVVMPTFQANHGMATGTLDSLVTEASGTWEGTSSDQVEAPIIRNTEFRDGEALDAAGAQVVSADRAALEAALLQDGDILVEKSGGSDTQSVGRVRLFTGDDDTYGFGNFISRLRVKNAEELSPAYLAEFLHHFYNQGHTTSMQKATNGFKNLAMSRYLQVDVPKPPFTDQITLVAQLAGLKKQVQEELRRAVEATEQLRMTLSVQTKIRFGDLAVEQTAVVAPSSLSGVINLVELADVESDTGRRIATDLVDSVTVKSSKKEFEAGDILFSKLRPNLNKVWVADAPGYASTEFLVYRTPEDAVVLAHALRQENIVNELVGATRGMKMPRIKPDQLEDCMISFSDSPAVTEQIHVNDQVIEAAKERLAELETEIYEVRRQNFGF